MGTPAYMAPEQAEGRTEQIGPHTDVFGLALLYEILTGGALRGESVQTVMTQSVLGRWPPHEAWPEVPPGLEAPA